MQTLAGGFCSIPGSSAASSGVELAEFRKYVRRSRHLRHGAGWCGRNVNVQMKDRNNRHQQEQNLLQLLAGIINYVSFDYRAISSIKCRKRAWDTTLNQTFALYFIVRNISIKTWTIRCLWAKHVLINPLYSSYVKFHMSRQEASNIFLVIRSSYLMSPRVK